ncbi:hypothetical protein UCRPC4_g06359 [Phaeomoniella chlamydospora]|uniref:Uncharacterized protein n=1 Tax=Phaeomoniella chlamydospora TaxID=158046 RepID=A0A0G2DX66_PHACM|nr:hypothetical protein UCRPC4_g06359 [Phaeomoniella chlamydospora]
MASYQTDSRPRTTTMASYESKKSGKSHKSHKSRSSGNSHKLDLTESARDKLRLHGKTDPSAAMTEMQPAAMALEQPTLANLRSASFTDRTGQPIHEPDSSNPARSKWESPLQTIRGFQDDIDRTYREKRVSSAIERPQSRGDMYGPRTGQSRRSSYFAAYNQQNQSQAHLSGYYRGNDIGDDSQMQQGPYTPNANGQYGSNAYGNPYSQNSQSPRVNRGPAEPMMNDSQQYYQYPQSREASTASPETDQFGISTGPSSYNSSYDHVAGMGSPTKPVSNPLPVPPRAPMRLNTGVDRDGGFENHVPENSKRQSWFKRRFSRD